MEWIKSHPYATAGIVFGVGLLILIVFIGSGSSSASQTNDNGAAALAAAQAQEAASGNALQQTQAELQASENESNNGVAANGTNDASAVSLAQIAANQSTNTAQIAADSAAEVAQFTAQASETASTASVSVAEAADTATTTQNLYDTLLGIGAQQNAVLGQANYSRPVAVTQGYLTPGANGGYSFGISSIPLAAYDDNGNIGSPGYGTLPNLTNFQAPVPSTAPQPVMNPSSLGHS